MDVKMTVTHPCETENVILEIDCVNSILRSLNMNNKHPLF